MAMSKEWHLEYSRRAEVVAKRMEYNKRQEVKERMRAYNREYKTRPEAVRKREEAARLAREATAAAKAANPAKSPEEVAEAGRARYLRRKADPDFQRKQREARYLKLYGMSLTDRDAMLLAQGGKCRICADGVEFDRGGRTNGGSSDGSAVVDHCHTTGAVRGVLCGRCNAGLGSFKDSEAVLEAAIRYLQLASTSKAA